MSRQQQVDENDSSSSSDEYVAITDAARLFPGRPHTATLWRWSARGVWRGDRNVRLQTVTCGGRRYTTRAWADAFIAACNADNPSPHHETDADAKRRAREAGKALEALGA